VDLQAYKPSRVNLYPYSYESWLPFGQSSTA